MRCMSVGDNERELNPTYYRELPRQKKKEFIEPAYTRLFITAGEEMIRASALKDTREVS